MDDIEYWIQEWLKCDKEDVFIQQLETDSSKTFSPEYKMRLIEAILESDFGEEITDKVLEEYELEMIEDRIEDICRVLTGKPIHELDVYTRIDLERIIGKELI